MKKIRLFYIIVTVVMVVLVVGGCVERKLTINTEPQGAVVLLNDEEVGVSPVTVSFSWYGDYNVMARKEGFETLKTHRLLEGPWYDDFPFDFFAGIVSSERIVDSYEWTFDLEPQNLPTQSELIEQAEELKSKL